MGLGLHPALLVTGAADTWTCALTVYRMNLDTIGHISFRLDSVNRLRTDCRDNTALSILRVGDACLTYSQDGRDREGDGCIL